MEMKGGCPELDNFQIRVAWSKVSKAALNSNTPNINTCPLPEAVSTTVTVYPQEPHFQKITNLPINVWCQTESEALEMSNVMKWTLISYSLNLSCIDHSYSVWYVHVSITYPIPSPHYLPIPISPHYLPIPIFVEHPERLSKFLLAVCLLHLFGHHVQEFIEVYRSITWSIQTNSLFHTLRGKSFNQSFETCNVRLQGTPGETEPIIFKIRYACLITSEIGLSACRMIVTCIYNFTCI